MEEVDTFNRVSA